MNASNLKCAAGAVILGKANLTEFANIIAIEMPSGYSSLGGQVKNPFVPSLVDEHGIPLVQPGGSSSACASDGSSSQRHIMAKQRADQMLVARGTEVFTPLYR